MTLLPPWAYRQKVRMVGQASPLLTVRPLRRAPVAHSTRRRSKNSFYCEVLGARFVLTPESMSFLTSCCRARIFHSYALSREVRNAFSQEEHSKYARTLAIFVCYACQRPVELPPAMDTHPIYELLTFSEFEEFVSTGELDPLTSIVEAEPAWEELTSLVQRLYGKTMVAHGE